MLSFEDVHTVAIASYKRRLVVMRRVIRRVVRCIEWRRRRSIVQIVNCRDVDVGVGRSDRDCSIAIAIFSRYV